MTQNLISTSSSFRVTRSMDGPNWTGTDYFSKPGQDQDQELKIYRRVPKPVIILKISDRLFPGYLTKTLSLGSKLW